MRLFHHCWLKDGVEVEQRCNTSLSHKSLWTQWYLTATSQVSHSSHQRQLQASAHHTHTHTHPHMHRVISREEINDCLCAESQFKPSQLDSFSRSALTFKCLNKPSQPENECIFDLPLIRAAITHSLIISSAICV